MRHYLEPMSLGFDKLAPPMNVGFVSSSEALPPRLPYVMLGPSSQNTAGSMSIGLINLVLKSLKHLLRVLVRVISRLVNGFMRLRSIRLVMSVLSSRDEQLAQQL